VSQTADRLMYRLAHFSGSNGTQHVTTINDRGEIAGTALLPNGETHAYLLVPCGEDGVACGK
jgi:hypothetical protein